MPRRPDMPCAKCGKPIWRSRTSLPEGQATCRECRLTQNPVTCGSMAGWWRHYRAKVEPCGACADAWRAYNREKHRQRRAARPKRAYPCVECGKERLAHQRPRSDRCVGCSNRARAQLARATPPPCKACGEPTPKRDRVFCSKACMVESMRLSNVESSRHLWSPLRRALEDGDAEGILAAIKSDCVITLAGCWEWQRATSGKPGEKKYAVVRTGSKKRQYLVHRLTAAARYGIRADEPVVHHKCANTICVNPDHLQPITHRENLAEMLERNYYVARIESLESALRLVDPSNPLLAPVVTKAVA